MLRQKKTVMEKQLLLRIEACYLRCHNFPAAATTLCWTKPETISLPTANVQKRRAATRKIIDLKTLAGNESECRPHQFHIRGAAYFGFVCVVFLFFKVSKPPFGDVFVFLRRRADERARERDFFYNASSDVGAGGARRGRLTACRGQGCLLSGGEKHPESAKKKKKSINS